jgi:hypothetical protein
LASKKVATPRVEEDRDKDNISTENHMQVFARLSKITNMHGHPGPRKPKGGGK